MGGVGLQEAFILCFLGLAFRFQRQMSRETPPQDKPRATQLLYTVYAALTLISVRPPHVPPFPPLKTKNHPSKTI